MRRLDERERRMSLWAALLGAAASIALWAPAFDKSAAVILAAIGVGLSGMLALAARSRGRLLTCLAAVLLGFGPWGFAWLLGLPYLLLATWLLFRERKAGRAGDVAAEDAGADEPARRRPRRAPKPAREPRRRDADPPGRPEASKRYTPPRRRR